VFAAWLGIDYDDISGGEQLLDNYFSVTGRQIRNDATFTPIPHMKAGGSSCFIATRRFNLDHLRALFGQQHASVGTSNALSQLNNAHSF
jgi:hypothetical protein